VLLIAAALLAMVPGSALGFSKAIWGPVYRNGVSQFPIYHQLGVSLYEADLDWSTVAPTRPTMATNPNDPAYHWPAEIDQAIAQARRFHMRVLLQIINSPRWAVGPEHANARDWAPTHASDFAAFATAAARRYPSVRLWMIWGEPNKIGNFQPLAVAQPGAPLNQEQQLGPHTYAGLLDAAYGALKRVSRRNLVIGGSTFTGSIGIDTLQFIQNMRLPNGRPPRMDMYAHNPFGYWDPTFSPPANESQYDSQHGLVQFIDLPKLAGWIDHYLHRGMPIFLSEWTIPTKADHEFDFWVDPPVAAHYISHALGISRRWHRIYGLGWINAYDTPGYSYGGLMDANGHKKPLFWAFARG
jgi:hypothetical protein